MLHFISIRNNKWYCFMIFKFRSGILKKLQYTILLGSLNVKFNLNIKTNMLNPMCDRIKTK